jgi:cell division protein FtsB
MAELTNIESKLGEVLGLAMASKGSVKQLAKLVEDEQLRTVLDRMHDEAAQTEERVTEVVSGFEGKKTAILEQARETKSEATEMMDTYISEESDGLDAFEFLTMAEAGEVGHWAIVKTMNDRLGDPRVGELVAWALPIQERHFEEVKQGSLKLAAEEDPTATS